MRGWGEERSASSKGGLKGCNEKKVGTSMIMPLLFLILTGVLRAYSGTSDKGPSPNLPIMDTFLGTSVMVVVFFSLRTKDNLCIKDSVAAPKVSFSQRFHCSSHALRRSARSVLTLMARAFPPMAALWRGVSPSFPRKSICAPPDKRA